MVESASGGDRIALARAYRSTCYCVYTPGRKIQLRAGYRNADMDALFKFIQETEASFLTAWNPRSLVLSANENKQRNDSLLSKILSAKLRYFPAVGIPMQSRWQPEESYLIVGLGLAEACRWAQEYEQNAFLYTAINQPSELVWVSGLNAD